MEHGEMMDAVTSQLTAAAMTVYFLQMLKKFGWYSRLVDAVPIDNAKIHRIVSAACAFFTGVGIHAAYTGSATIGWHVSLTIPPLMTVLHAAWDWAEQFAMNQVLYDAVAQKAGVAGQPPTIMMPPIQMQTADVKLGSSGVPPAGV